ncbi:hypothetical protein GCM10023156_49660 [Novipirellula rosea]|uniref:Uncharacterized protein n=1 Tax=Novipirellula rosea TaxID=1031540 RepID=A0ABP8NDR5_9BACT
MGLDGAAEELMGGASEMEAGPHPDEALRARPTSPVLRSGEVAEGEYVTFDSVASVCSCSNKSAQLLLAFAAGSSCRDVEL